MPQNNIKQMLVELLDEVIAEKLADTLALATARETVQASVPQEPRYIVYIGKKSRNVKAPYIALNAEGQLSGFTEEDDVLGYGTNRIGKFTLAEINERFPQFNHPEFLVEVN